MLSLHFKALFCFINIVTAALLTTLCTLNRECSWLSVQHHVC